MEQNPIEKLSKVLEMKLKTYNAVGNNRFLISGNDLIDVCYGCDVRWKKNIQPKPLTDTVNAWKTMTIRYQNLLLALSTS